jgi:hypothetical protein
MKEEIFRKRISKKKECGKGGKELAAPRPRLLRKMMERRAAFNRRKLKFFFNSGSDAFPQKNVEISWS